MFGHQHVGRYSRIGEEMTRLELLPQPYHLAHIALVEAIIKLARGHDSRMYKYSP